MKSRTFVDSVTLYAKAGNGGNGCASFRREKFVPKGGPSGGDGGQGGHVILRCDRDVDSLLAIYYAPHQRAQNAEHGQGKDRYGHKGRDLIVPVPRGTEVWDAERTRLLFDLVEHGQEARVAAGGKGGLGNIHWKSPTHQAPTEQTDGVPGEEVTLRLSLKLVANVGLVGYPNAGKSSLLSVISDAHPKIAAYPFTTLNPIIGTVIYEDYTRITVADIPGIIKGAHEGIGLGHEFLKHIERAKILAYVVDMAGVDGRDPVEDYRSLRQELKLHRGDLIQRPFVVVANKMDLPEAEANIRNFSRKTRTKPVRVSTVTRTGIDALKAAIYDLSRPA